MTNVIVIAGRVTANATLQVINRSTICNFNLANNRKKPKEIS